MAKLKIFLTTDPNEANVNTLIEFGNDLLDIIESTRRIESAEGSLLLNRIVSSYSDIVRINFECICGFNFNLHHVGKKEGKFICINRDIECYPFN